MVRLDNVSFQYNAEHPKVLDSINIEVPKGQCILLCGRSGCGKSTILKLINGIIPHVSDGIVEGDIYIDDQQVSQVPMYILEKKIGTVFQNPKSQFFNLDSDSELSFELENNGVEPDRIRKRMEQVTNELEIENLRHRNIFGMSGGEKQLLAIAAVFAAEPEIYIFDEPSANLDYVGILKLKRLLEKLKADGKTIIIAEHRLSYLSSVVDKTYYMERGRIKYTYSGREFYAFTEKKRIELGLRRLYEDAYKVKEKTRNRDDIFIGKSIHVAYDGSTILNDIDFTASQGDIIGVVGKNGAGKSTFCRVIAGLVKKASGDFVWEEKRIKDRKRRTKCHFIMQDVNHQLFSDSVINECEAFMDIVDEKRIKDILDIMDLTGLEDQHPMALSGGQKQRLAIATGMLSDRSIYLFDEPTSGLDYESMIRVKEQLENLANQGAIVLLITHDFELLDLVCNRCLFFENGSIRELSVDKSYSKQLKERLLSVFNY